MASLPQRPQSQPRPSQEPSSNQHQQQQYEQPPHSPTFARSVASEEDSPALFLNSTKQTPSAHALPAHAPQPPHPDADSDLKKCWICFSDETEDTPQTSPWRDPCPCALVAHEECLLDWIADTEAPKNTRNRSLAAPKIKCPQCKAEIKLARPTNYLVEAVRAIDRVCSRAATPGAVLALSSMVYSSSLALGEYSIYAVFGAEDGYRILWPIIRNTTRPPVEVLDGILDGNARQAGRQLLGAILTPLVHWRLYVGVPLVTPVLILSRMNFADSLLPVLPILFFATQTPSRTESFEFLKWPPSASLAFAVLPYVRSAYNAYYQKVWAEKERQWLKQVRPRFRESGDNGQVLQDQVQPRDDGNLFQVRIEGDMWEEWEDDEAPINQPRAQPQAQAQPPPNIADNRQANPPQQPQQPQANGQQGEGRRLAFSPLHAAETILGAIVFPFIAGLSGDALKFLLPKAWTAPLSTGVLGFRRVAQGLLQKKWGRSLVGGCLFVVCKDALMLYMRFKMAQMHTRRRVLDFDRGRARGGTSRG